MPAEITTLSIKQPINESDLISGLDNTSGIPKPLAIFSKKCRQSMSETSLFF